MKSHNDEVILVHNPNIQHKEPLNNVPDTNIAIDDGSLENIVIIDIDNAKVEPQKNIPCNNTAVEDGDLLDVNAKVDINEPVTKVGKNPMLGYDHGAVSQQGSQFQQSGQYQERRQRQYGRNKYYGQTPFFQQMQSEPPASNGPPPYYNQTGTYEMEALMFGFESPRVRRTFIQNVFLILTVQLSYTVIFISVVVFSPYWRIWVARSFFLALAAIVVMVVCYLMLMCCECARKTFPFNFILLIILTISLSFIAVYVTCRYETYIIFGSMGITALVCLLITLCAILLPFDMTARVMYLIIAGFVAGICSLIFIIVLMFYRSYILSCIYFSMMGLLFCMYLWFDVQMVIGGKTYQLEPDEYIAGAVQIYIDIIYIFMVIAQLWGSSAHRS